MSSEQGISPQHQAIGAASAVIAAFERPGHNVEHQARQLVTTLGGNWDQVEDCESPYAIMAYFLALAVRNANQTK